uniref:autophagy-related protein 9A n=1 Tax=Ciona intestinalis TaxID=7719 RepID=UPI000180B654|nr:autophagy-related protein 9A [Ciona intestinalis]|eukprot:XP_018666906.1 autophagy-related protein 9A [Ciona intestinalis]
MAEFQTSYYKFDSPSDEEIPNNEEAYLMHAADRNKAQWHHIEDLDGFFVRVYQYHQNHGFGCILLQQIFELVQFIFVVVFATFLLVCVDYDILFANKLPPGFDVRNLTDKVTLDDAVISSAKCTERVGQNGVLVLFILIAAVFWTLRAVKVFYNFFRLLEIRKFYNIALRIKQNDLDNNTWHEVQQRLMLVQEEQQMCIHKQQLTELDVYNRILRFKNYMIAMVNKGLFPPKFRVPILGDVVFFTQSMKYNMELIFFWGPRAIFANSYHMKDEYKSKSRRDQLAAKLSSDLLWLGLINLLLSPIILMWQILYSFFSYAEVLKREPGSFGARRWSMYSRLYLRHFNELPHEFQARLNRGHKPASTYMATFTSPVLTVLAKNVAFFVGSLLAVLLVLTVWDEDVLKVEHVLTALTIFSIIITICKSFIPDEHAVSCPEQLMRQVVAQVHYAPDSWRGQAHTCNVRDQFAQLFQFKAAFVIEELLSPIITPLLLIFWMRGKSHEIIDFFRNFTVDIAGVGDVCSFAQLNVNKHGDPQWQTESSHAPSFKDQADDGKTELSLMHFAITNPKWVPPPEENQLLESVRAHAQKDAAEIADARATQNPLLTSLQSLGSVDMLPTSILLSGYGSFPAMQSTTGQQTRNPNGQETAIKNQQRHPTEVYRGLSSSEGPVGGATDGLFSSVISGQRDGFPANVSLDRSLQSTGFGQMNAAEKVREMASLEMSMGALYMHELHHQRLNLRHERMMWETIPDDVSSCQGDPSQSNVASQRFNPSQRLDSGYKATGLAKEDIFGKHSADVKTIPNFSSKRQVSPTDQPFISMDVRQPLQVPDDNTSDSDAAPQEFHLTDNHSDDEEIPLTLRTEPSTSNYLPPQV